MLKFMKEFIKNPKFIGAVAPSSKYLAEKMVEDIKFEKTKCIIEYGPGTGVFTEKIIARKREDTLLLVFEKNKGFCDNLLKIYGCKKNVKIINDGAENIKKYLIEQGINQVDYVISGLPFTSLPTNISNIIIQNTKDILSSNGEFITFQYSLLKKAFFESRFSNIKFTKEIRNFPPAYVLKCSLSEV